MSTRFQTMILLTRSTERVFSLEGSGFTARKTLQAFYFFPDRDRLESERNIFHVNESCPERGDFGIDRHLAVRSAAGRLPVETRTSLDKMEWAA